MSIVKLKNISYQILRDHNKPLAFVGNTYFNAMLHKYFSAQGKDSTLLSVENAQTMNQEWFDSHQFICVSSNVATKRMVVDGIAKFKPDYFSIVGSNNLFLNLPIGEGSYIEHNTTAMWEGCSVGNHCTILSYNQIAHDVTINDFCHISGYSFLSYCEIGRGNCMALRTNILGDLKQPISTADNCNFMINSVVTKDVTETGTYFGNRRVKDDTSLNYDIL